MTNFVSCQPTTTTLCLHNTRLGSCLFTWVPAQANLSLSVFNLLRRTLNFGTKLKASPPPFLWFHLKDLPTHARTTTKKGNPRRRVGKKRCKTFHHPNHKIATCHSLDGVGKIKQQKKCDVVTQIIRFHTALAAERWTPTREKI